MCIRGRILLGPQPNRPSWGRSSAGMDSVAGSVTKNHLRVRAAGKKPDPTPLADRWLASLPAAVPGWVGRPATGIQVSVLGWVDPGSNPDRPADGSAGVTRRNGLTPPGDVLRAAWSLADVASRRTDETTGALLLEHVSRPPGGACAGEHRREHRGGNLGEVKQDGGPELDVRGEHPVGATGMELVERSLFQSGRDGEAWCAQALAGSPQHARARVLRAIHAVAETHQPIALVEHALDVCRGVAAP